MVLMGFPDKNILVFEISSLKTGIFCIEKIQMAENFDFDFQIWPTLGALGKKSHSKYPF